MEWFTASLGILGVITGGTLQYFFSKATADRQHIRFLQTEAAIDYLRAVTEIPRAKSNKDREELFSKITYAKARLCAYGPAKVVSALAEFDRKGGNLDTFNSIEKFVRICTAIRNANPKSIGEVKPEDLRDVLFDIQKI